MNKRTLEELFNAMYHGKYSFEEFRSIRIEDEVEVIELKDRKVFSPSEKLRTFHKFLNLMIFENLKIASEVVFSYRKGANTVQAVKAHSGNKFFFSTDIAKFFGSIDQHTILKTIQSNFEVIPVSDMDEMVEWVTDLVTFNGTLPLGFSTSPLISNAVLFDLDREILNLSKKKSLIYTRYADDIIISSNTLENISNLEEEIETVLTQLYGNKFELNRSKTKYTHLGNKISILGVSILPDGSISVERKFKKKIEYLLFYFVNDKEAFIDASSINNNSSKKITYEKAVEKLIGMVNYVSMVDTNYLNKLKKKYGVSVIELLIHNKIR